MSVLIKGFRLPPTCNNCIFGYSCSDEHEEEYGCALNGMEFENGLYNRPKDCPIVYVPNYKAEKIIREMKEKEDATDEV